MSSREITKKQYKDLGIPEAIKGKEVLSTLAEIGCYLDYSITRVRQAIKNEGLPAATRATGQWFTTKSLIDKWIMELHAAKVAANNWDRTIQHGPNHGKEINLHE